METLGRICLVYLFSQSMNYQITNNPLIQIVSITQILNVYSFLSHFLFNFIHCFCQWMYPLSIIIMPRPQSWMLRLIVEGKQMHLMFFNRVPEQAVMVYIFPFMVLKKRKKESIRFRRENQRKTICKHFYSSFTQWKDS